MWDEKRPFCVLAGGRCDFQRFMDQKSRFAWDWQLEKVDFSYASNQVSPGIGALAAEAPRYLAFMNKYTVGGPYGVDRSTIADKFHQHWGGMDGARSWVAQFPGGKVEYEAFGRNPDGTQNYDYAKSNGESCTTIPKGANFFFAMNQSSDPKCTVASGCKSLCKDEACLANEKQDVYDRYEQILKGALCKSTWTLPPQ